ncbi:MAG: MBL fold metallo-hydrolase [Candidatus Terrybacteria bacterium]|nr:MBL fold metallo-hydrolase [Candidatus Terrybacteria bacterium]
MAEKLKLSFWGASQEVTGSNYLLETPSSKILIDCGFFQGSRINEERNRKPFFYNPSEIDGLIVTHAHLDHIGRIPKLVRDGFRGKIFSTPATRSFSQLMLTDSLGVLEKEVKRSGEKEMIYTEKDVERAMAQWEEIEYCQEFALNGLKIKFRDAGHILGSTIAEIVAGSRKIVFTGDLGNSPEPLLNDTEIIKDADFLIIESTYGDRVHESSKEAELKLERTIEDVVHNKGVLMIPAFSLERTQKILFQLNELVEHGRIPRVPVFLDSPLSIQATKIYKEYSRYYNEEAKKILYKDDIFNFPGLKQTLTTEESKEIGNIPPPKIIIAGSGMCNGGRILHHLRQNLSNQNSAVLLVSYQAVGSLGRQLAEKAKMVSIFGEKVLVEAKIEKISGYSSHPDREALYNFTKNTADSLKKVFVVHGELKSSLFFTQRLRDYLGIDALAPKFGESYEI